MDSAGRRSPPPPHARQLWQSTLFSHGEADLSLDWPTVESYLTMFPGRTPVNVVPQVPHCAVRMAVMGWDARPATDAEIGRMKTIVREWMEAGAVCLNLGLDYQPSAFADTRELIELSSIVREYGGIYAAHVRYTDLGRAAAWRETMVIGRGAAIPVHISHEHVDDVTEPLLEEAERICDLTFESYLYPAGCTHLALMLPTWAQAGGPDGVRARLQDPEMRNRIRQHLQDRLTVDSGGARAVVVGNRTGLFIGWSLDESAEAEGLPMGEVAVTMLEDEHPYVLMVYHRGMTAEEQHEAVWRTVRHPRMMVASDGIYHGRSSHPRGYGCFTRVLRLGVREMGAISLEEAIYKMSGFPAERFRINDRGLLRPGYGADVLIFDPETVADRATWEEPRLEPVGIDRVIVNGETVVEGGDPTGALPGRVLRAHR
ncbi:MAG TPA: amidohydrolase family protein [Thermomicrobiales bacterium]|nr:amidohydrolase family protein [Thermomicrobiales bacterium]